MLIKLTTKMHSAAAGYFSQSDDWSLFDSCIVVGLKSLLTCIIIIIIMEICKAPTLRLKAQNKHTHIMYIDMENVIKKRRKDIDNGF